MLREVTDQDYLAWWRIYMDDSVNPFMFYDQMSAEQFKAEFDDMRKKGPVFVYEKNHEIVGICQLILLTKPHQDTLIIGTVAIDPNQRRKGYASTIFKDIFKWIKTTHPEIVRVELYTETDNPKARKCYEKLGFKTEVIFEDWFKRHGGTYKDKWYMAEHIMTLMLSEVPNTSSVNIAKLKLNTLVNQAITEDLATVRLATQKDEKEIFNLINQHDSKLFTDLFAADQTSFQTTFKKWLKQNIYVLVKDKKIIACCYIKHGAGRLSHGAFLVNFFIVKNYDEALIQFFLTHIIVSQRQQNIKLICMNLVAHDQHLINSFLNAGFDYRGALQARFKHPTTNKYFDEIGLEYSFFNLEDAIQCIQASENNKLDKNELINYLSKMRTLNLEFTAQNLIYKFVRDVCKTND